MTINLYIHGVHEKDIDLIEQTVIGRGEPEHTQDVQIEHMVLSKKHGEFYCEQGEWCYRDLGSSNGSYLNGTLLETPCRLQNGDRLSFQIKGSPVALVECIVQLPQEKTQTVSGQKAHLASDEQRADSRSGKPRQKARDEEGMLQIDIKKRIASVGHHDKILLQDIHLQVAAGEMTLILGGSGAGKTTFINAVMGYEKADGRIRYGSKDIYADYEQMKYEIGFVPQKDLLRDADSVYDTLYNAVQMKMPEVMDEPDHIKRVEEIMELLGLTKQRDTLVKKLSGGQRKRLSIAMEFAGDPQIFFLDEPDSGLDGVMARTLMEKLREIADMGKIVMVITHAPDRVAELFDKVIVLAKGSTDDIGHLVYHGTIKNAREFFQTDSLEDIVRRINPEVEGGEGRADEFIEKYNKR